MINILVCDDEKDIVGALTIYLKAEGYRVFGAYNGHQALEIVEQEDIHLVLLDIMMPGLDGIETISRIREGRNIPVIFLSAKSEDTDKIAGLNLGADDYVTKPFNPAELMARVRSQLRRYTQLGSVVSKDSVLSLGGIRLDDDTKEVTVDGEHADLTVKEYDILKYLMEHKGKVFSPQEIYHAVWKESPVSSDHTVAVHVRHLREKIEINPAEPRYLKAVWGRGYKMEDIDESSCDI